MRTKISKIIALALVFSLVCGSLAGAVSMPDVPENYWGAATLEKAVEYGILKGDAETGNLRPEAFVKRGEFFAMINRAFGFVLADDSGKFSDFSPNAWYADDISVAAAQGYLKGDANGKANPEANITRAEAFAIVSRVMKLAVSKGYTTFDDRYLIPSWFDGELAAMQDAGYIQGSDNMINPMGNLKRVEAAQVLVNVIGLLLNEADTYTFDADGNVTVTTTGVSIENSEIGGNLYITEGVGNGDVFVSGTNIEGNLIVAGGGANSFHFTGGKVGGKLQLSSRPGYLGHGTRVVLEEATVNTIGADADSGTNVESKGTVIENLVVEDGATTSITGEATILNATVGTGAALELTNEVKLENVTIGAGASLNVPEGYDLSTTNIAVTDGATIVTVNEQGEATVLVAVVAEDGTAALFAQQADGTLSEKAADIAVTVVVETPVEPEAPKEEEKKEEPKTDNSQIPGGNPDSGSSTKSVTLTAGKFYKKVESSTTTYAKEDGSWSNNITEIAAIGATKQVTVASAATVTEATAFDATNAIVYKYAVDGNSVTDITTNVTKASGSITVNMAQLDPGTTGYATIFPVYLDMDALLTSSFKGIYSDGATTKQIVPLKLSEVGGGVSGANKWEAYTTVGSSFVAGTAYKDADLSSLLAAVSGKAIYNYGGDTSIIETALANKTEININIPTDEGTRTMIFDGASFQVLTINVTASAADLAQAKNDKKNEIDTLISTLTQVDYTVASWSAVTSAIGAAKSAIDLLTTVAAVNSYNYSAVTTAINSLVEKTTADDALVTAKATDVPFLTATYADKAAAAAAIKALATNGTYASKTISWAGMTASVTSNAGGTLNFVFTNITELKVTFTAAQTGGTTGTANSTGIVLTFDKTVTGLVAGDITIANGTGAAVKGTLSGSGTTYTIALTSVTTEGNVTVSVANFGDYTVTTASQTVAVFKNSVVPVPSATAGDATISGTVGTLITPTAITITLTNTTFNVGSVNGGDIVSWASLPAGLSMAYTSSTGTAIVLTISGTPTVASTDALTITIPAGNLTSGAALTVAANANLKFAIADPAPSTYTATVNVTIDGTAQNVSSVKYGVSTADTPMTLGAQGTYTATNVPTGSYKVFVNDVDTGLTFSNATAVSVPMFKVNFTSAAAGAGGGTVSASATNYPSITSNTPVLSGTVVTFSVSKNTSTDIYEWSGGATGTNTSANVTYNTVVTGPIICTLTRTYSVQFDKNGGDTEASPATISGIPSGDSIDGFGGSFPTPPTRAGYGFVGWWMSNGAGSNWGAPFLETTAVTGNTQVYARWAVIKVFNESVSGTSFYDDLDTALITAYNASGKDNITLLGNATLSTTRGIKNTDILDCGNFKLTIANNVTLTVESAGVLKSYPYAVATTGTGKLVFNSSTSKYVQYTDFSADKNPVNFINDALSAISLTSGTIEVTDCDAAATLGSSIGKSTFTLKGAATLNANPSGFNGMFELQDGSEYIIDTGATFTVNGNLIIKDGASLTNNGTLTVNGAIVVENGAALNDNGTISGSGNVTYPVDEGYYKVIDNGATKYASALGALSEDIGNIALTSVLVVPATVYDTRATDVVPATAWGDGDVITLAPSTANVYAATSFVNATEGKLVINTGTLGGADWLEIDVSSVFASRLTSGDVATSDFVYAILGRTSNANNGYASVDEGPYYAWLAVPSGNTTNWTRYGEDTKVIPVDYTQSETFSVTGVCHVPSGNSAGLVYQMNLGVTAFDRVYLFDFGGEFIFLNIVIAP